MRDVNTVICLLHKVIKLCAEGGFQLTNFVSNKVEVLQSICEVDRRDGLKNIDINSGSDLPTEKALGINWNIENHKLGFKVNLGNEPYTRGMLSVISKIYDPLGSASTFLLKGKKILQELCKNNFSWDEQVSAEITEEWEQWKNDLKLLENINLDRSFKPPRFGRLIDGSLYHFSDPGLEDYRQVSYLRLVDEDGHIHYSLVTAKSRVTPLNFVSIQNWN